MSGSVVLVRVGLLADDVGRLRRHLASLIDDYDGSYTGHLVERIGRHLRSKGFDQGRRPR